MDFTQKKFAAMREVTFPTTSKLVQSQFTSLQEAQ
jgi:hypothetical protein